MKKILLLAALFLAPFLGKAQEQFSVYFDTNKFDLKKSEQQKLDTWIAQHKDVKILAISGYTDEDGTTSHNDTLSQRRVAAVFAKIKGKIKTREDFKTLSFGEMHEQSGDKALNRKVEIYYLLAKDLGMENEIVAATKPKAAKEPEEVHVKPLQPVVYPKEVTVKTPTGKDEVIQLDPVFMKKIGDAKAGAILRIDNMNFQENTFAVMPGSRPKLYELLEVMKLNPGLKIKLQGHVCCMSADRNDLSTQRAKAIMMFLNQNGIDKSRLSFQGFGVSQPVYTIPEKTPEEREANRRVEVLIVENN
jgi:outer membrane protein OmpA-like peptidoglycan-associated protein